jgi:hypothetical protein
MRKLKIGYWPLSSNLKSPGDRRRVVFWAEARGHSIVTDLTQNVDAIVVSENSDFNSAVLAQREIPVILDLVDAYLSPLNPIDDLARGLVKKVSGQISGGLKPFSHHIRDVCLSSRAVICSSLELTLFWIRMMKFPLLSQVLRKKIQTMKFKFCGKVNLQQFEV